MRVKDTMGLSRVLSMAKHEMRQQMDEVLKPLGLSAAQYGALSTLEENERLTNAQLARECYVTPQTMFRIMQGMKERGFVATEDHAEHGLKIDFKLTKKALDTLCDAHEIVHDLEKRMTKGMSKAEIKALMETLEQSFKNLREGRD